MTTTEDPQDDPVKRTPAKTHNHAPTGNDGAPKGGTNEVNLSYGPKVLVKARTSFWSGDADNPRKPSLEIRKHSRSSARFAWDWNNPTWCVTLNEEQITKLRAYLNGDFISERIGHYFWVQVDDQDTAEALQRMVDGEAAVDLDVEKITSAMSLNDDLLTAVLDGDQGRTLMRLKEHDRRSDVLDELEDLIEDPKTVEQDFQDLLQVNPWVFGGEVSRSHALRNISTQDQIDIPIVRGDGSMVIVELKRAKAAQIKKTDHEYPVLSDGVHTAVQQAERYLYVLDKKVNDLQIEQQFDARRATALVVIGVWPDLEDSEKKLFEESFRIYNSHLARVQVITYDSLLANARRLLDLGDESTTTDDGKST
ncbi:Shedu anti-phage system protein SduA domain-containing protein [Corynebacterium terpenotabidum]|uniref:Shedu protein SduA C-terminal domain-containing protein n=1 Tax=Corynebacterium terpenotabidum Y-11 TaxID=1200352 RepID=S4XCA6_9CORY|nr:Shedu anti-phage system protein SduA domain-containing protein [Corynebacterium terpenotabidum]AGP30119.1 hypothetical protein A606_02330 [Corynebacterium terpenotabidum Y-11]